MAGGATIATQPERTVFLLCPNWKHRRTAVAVLGLLGRKRCLSLPTYLQRSRQAS